MRSACVIFAVRCRIAVIVAGLVLGAQGASGQATVRGTMVDAISNAPVAEGVITAIRKVAGGTDVVVDSTRGNDDGEFSIRLDSGTYELSARKIGYDVQIAVVSVRRSGRTSLTMLMKRAANVLDTVRIRNVAAGPQFSWRYKYGGGRILTLDDFKARNVNTVESALSSIPGIRFALVCRDTTTRTGPVNGSSNNTTAVQTCYRTLRTRAFDRNPTCLAPRLILNGGVSNQLTMDELMGITSTDVFALEVYQSVAVTPPEYASANLGCGLIVVWTVRPPI